MSFKTNYQPFAIEDRVSIVEGQGGFPTIKIDNEHASALISIYGAQLLSYIAKSKDTDEPINKDLLFVSDLAYFEQGKAIKGGIPICWPWFGKDPENKGRQMHGFARNMLWKLDQTSQLVDGTTQVILSLSDTEDTHKLWPHQFHLTLTIDIGRSLTLSLKTTNTSNQTFAITQALHSYFSITDIKNVKLEGLNGTFYLDKVTNAEQAIAQKGSILVNQEVDRIYIDAPSQITLHDVESQQDKESQQKVRVHSSGSKTTVVWNPWIEISKNSGDLSDDAYHHFICVETANAAKDTIDIEPNASFTIGAEYTIS